MIKYLISFFIQINVFLTISQWMVTATVKKKKNDILQFHYSFFFFFFVLNNSLNE